MLRQRNNAKPEGHPENGGFSIGDKYILFIDIIIKNSMTILHVVTVPSVGGFDEHATPSGGKYRSGAAGGSCWGCAVTLVVVLTGDPDTGRDLVK